MAAKQFGFVIARALAVYLLAQGLNHLYIFAMQQSQIELMGNYKLPVAARVVDLASLAVYVLAAAFLWTTADKFAGDQSDSRPTFYAGNWAVRLALTSLGVLLMIDALNPIATTVYSIFQNQSDRVAGQLKVLLTTELVKFAIGLGIFLTYRFDRVAAEEAAQSIHTSEEP